MGFDKSQTWLQQADMDKDGARDVAPDSCLNSKWICVCGGAIVAVMRVDALPCMNCGCRNHQESIACSCFLCEQSSI